MDIFMVAVTALLVGAAGMWFLRSRSGENAPVGPELSALRAEVRGLHERVGADARALGDRLEGIDTRVGLGLSESAGFKRDIFETLADVRRATTTVADQAREFNALQDLLRAPKARGGLGEAMLAELLGQVLPPQAFELQHRFSSGAIVDAVVKAGGKLVPIDSKFPLANYRRMCTASGDLERVAAERAFAGDVDRHIADVSSRYIMPGDNTFDFAVMYVPAEGVYAEVLRLAHRKQPLFEGALERRVVPMSPLTLYGYLQTILFGLRCLSIERSAEAVLRFSEQLQRDLDRFATEYETLGRHLANARSKHEEGRGKLDRFRDGLERVSELSGEAGGVGAVPHLGAAGSPRDGPHGVNGGPAPPVAGGRSGAQSASGVSRS